MPRAQTAIRDEIAALKRSRILSTTVELFYENGYENTTLEAVADRLGVSKPFIYAHFNSKADLLAEICSKAITSSLAAIDAALAEKATPREQLDDMAKRFVVAVCEAQPYLAIFAREEKNLRPEDFERISTMRREFDRKLTGILKAGMESGEFHTADARIAALAIGGMVSWSYVWYRPQGRLSIAEIADEFSTLIGNMVR